LSVVACRTAIQNIVLVGILHKEETNNQNYECSSSNENCEKEIFTVSTLGVIFDEIKSSLTSFALADFVWATCAEFNLANYAVDDVCFRGKLSFDREMSSKALFAFFWIVRA
jgi:hypothetical protein